MQLTLHPKGGYDIKIIAAIVAIGWLLTHFLTSFAQTNVDVGDTANSRWVGTWSASVQKPSPRLPTVELDNQTIRQVVHVSIGGDRVRVRLSNVFGQDTLIINTASVGVRSKDAAVEIGSLHPLKFNGQSSVRIPAGARVYSDPVDLTVEDEADLAISIFIPGKITPQTTHALANQTSFISPKGNFVSQETMPVEKKIGSWFWVSGVDVLADAASRAVVFIGDSITDGAASTADTNARYPDVVAGRLVDHYSEIGRVSVLNAGISGNRILTNVAGPNALARINRDVLSQSGAAYLVILEGINDFGFSEIDPATVPSDLQLPDVSADELIDGIKQLILQARDRGLNVYVGTILPYKGAGYFSVEGEKKRQAVNEWIRSSKSFDAVIDFDEHLRDPSNPDQLLPKYDSGDNLHPSDDGYRAMGEMIDLDLFRTQH